METISQNTQEGGEMKQGTVEHSQLPADQKLVPKAPQEKPRFLPVDGHLGRYVNIIFAASPKANPRNHAWKQLDPNTNTPVRSSVTSALAERRHLWTPHFRLFLGLNRLARRTKKNSDGKYEFDLRDLAKESGYKWHGRAGAHRRGKQHKNRSLSTPAILSRILKDLRLGGYYANNTYFDAATRSWHHSEDVTTILDHIHIDHRVPVDETGHAHPEQLHSRCTFRFSEDVEKFRQNYSFPVADEDILSIDPRNALAPLLLAYLSVMLNDKPMWRRDVVELVATDLRYVQSNLKPAVARRMLERALTYVNGRAVTTGTVSARIESNQAGDSYNLVVHKEPFQLTLHEEWGSGKKPLDRRHGYREPWQRRPTKEEQARINVLLEDLLAVGQDLHSTVFYTTAARRFTVTGHGDKLYMPIATARAAKNMGEIRDSAAKLLTSQILELADKLRIPLRRPQNFQPQQDQPEHLDPQLEPTLHFATVSEQEKPSETQPQEPNLS
jgi:hypothetical protein